MQVNVKMVNGESLVGDKQTFQSAFRMAKEQLPEDTDAIDVAAKVVSSIEGFLGLLSNGVANIASLTVTVDGEEICINTNHVNYLFVSGKDEFLEEARQYIEELGELAND